MTFTEAAAQVLRLVGKPLHYKEITDVAIEKDLLSHVGKSPEVTMGARLAALVKKGDKDNPLVRVKPGVFALREWDKQTIEQGLADRTPALKRLRQNEANGAAQPSEDSEPEAAPEESAADSDVPSEPSSPEPDDDEYVALDDDERARAELAATASELFAAEDDDDEPILGGGDEDRSDDAGGGRRRRRRRRRGRNGSGGDDLPTYTVSDAPAEDLAEAYIQARADGAERRGRERDRDRGERDRDRDRGERDRDRDRGERDRDRGERDRDRGERDRDRGDRVGTDELSGEPLAEVLAQVLGGHERQGGVGLKQLVEVARRRVKLGGDAALSQSLVVACVRGDNYRRAALGQRERFRLSAGRVALTEWDLEGEARRLERDIQSALERYRSAVRKSLLRRLGDLPPRAFAELFLVLLERLGVAEVEPVRRQGLPPGEVHFTGKVVGPAGELRTAIVLKRDGREVGRERVTELRGALHHYGPAHAGWIVTTGQVLSGAREEASAPAAAPVRLLDGPGLARLCEEHSVAVVNTILRLPVPDGELFDALRMS